MSHRHEIAIAVYEDAIDRLARLAGEQYAVKSAASLAGLTSRAQGLALPGQLEEHNDQPVMRSVLGRIHNQESVGYYRPVPLSAKRSVVIPHQERPNDVAASYQTLWRALQHEFQQMPNELDPAVREASLHAALQRFAWSVPAPPSEENQHDTDVSLFDYARISAALAVCLDEARNDEEPVAVLVGGDLSGVQDWLYTFGSQGAAKNLRGRSFYLQLLTEVIPFYILDQLKLPTANLLYAGGGNFYLLAPLTMQKEIAGLQRAISRRLLAMHGGEIYVALAATPVTTQDLTGGEIGQIWQELNQNLNQVKSRRFAELDDGAMALAIGSPLAMNGDPLRTCSVCRRALDEGETGSRDDEDMITCALCLSFEKLGNSLRDAEYLTLCPVSPQQTASVIDWQQGLRQLGYDVQLLQAASTERGEAWKDPGSDLVRIFHWQEEPDPLEFPGPRDNQRMVWAYRPLAQAVPETDDREIATFDQLQSAGIKRWGVLRMDVDWLGTIFQRGIPDSNLCRVVGLSGLLRLFFEGYVPQLAEKYNEHAPSVYLMYAGGDDLFVVGGWSHLPHLAQDIRDAFVEFGCRNPKLGISAGISLALAEKYPLYQAARDAGEAEHQAKDLAGKNAISFLGQGLPWERADHRDFRRVRIRVLALCEWLDPSTIPLTRLPRSVLNILHTIDVEWRQWKNQESDRFEQTNHKPRYIHAEPYLYIGPWQWHLVYQLTRTADRTNTPEIQRYMLDYAEAIIQGEITILGVTGRWTELLTRTVSKS